MVFLLKKEREGAISNAVPKKETSISKEPTSRGKNKKFTRSCSPKRRGPAPSPLTKKRGEGAVGHFSGKKLHSVMEKRTCGYTKGEPLYVRTSGEGGNQIKRGAIFTLYERLEA